MKSISFRTENSATLGRMLRYSPVFCLFSEIDNGDVEPVFCAVSGDFDVAKHIQRLVSEDVTIDIYRNGYIFTQRSAVIKTDRSFQKLFLLDESAEEGDIDHLLLVIFRYRLIVMGSVCAHSAAIMLQERVIFFAGNSGAGKSTQARLWKKYLKCNVLNFDKPAILFDKVEKVAIGHGTPWSGKENCFINSGAKLSGIFVVVQSRRNYVERLGELEAYITMFHLYNPNPFTDELSDKYSDLIGELVKQVPVYRLYCTESDEAILPAFQAAFPELNYEEVRKVYRIGRQYTLREIAGEWIVIKRGIMEAVPQADTFILNETGMFLWNILKDGCTENDLVEALAKEYDISEVQAKQDTTAFIDNLKKSNILEEL